jgi:molybdate transport system substrate-binding protein
MLLAALLCTACAPRHAPATLTIAAAADLQFALQDLSQQFQAAHPDIHFAPVYGSSGNFYTQLLNGAPFDLFLSADLEYPHQLAQRGLAHSADIFPYAVGRLALWVPAQSPLDVAVMRMKILDDPAVKHIAIANPQHAPYGRAAEAALRHWGIYDRVAPKLVLGENIAQTLQYIQSGAAEAGFVALSLATAPKLRGQGRYWEVPLNAYPTLWQAGVILHRSPAAQEFRDYLDSPAGRRILQQYGFSLPGK